MPRPEKLPGLVYESAWGFHTYIYVTLITSNYCTILLIGGFSKTTPLRLGVKDENNCVDWYLTF